MCFSLIAGYISPRAVFDEKHLNTIFQNCKARYILAEDYNAHNPFRGNTHITARGRHLDSLSTFLGLFALNDGSQKHLQGTYYSSCLDPPFASGSRLSNYHWFADLETHASDHVPTYVTISTFSTKLRCHPMAHRDWNLYSMMRNVEGRGEGKCRRGGRAILYLFI